MCHCCNGQEEICSLEKSIRVATCIAAPIMLPLAFTAGVAEGAVSGSYYSWIYSYNMVKEKGHHKSFNIGENCFCLPCHIVIGEISYPLIIGSYYTKKVVNFMADTEIFNTSKTKEFLEKSRKCSSS